MKRLAALSACLMLVACESTMPPPIPLAMVASLNGMDIERGPGNVAPWPEEALCVHATDDLISKGSWDFQKPVSVYWNEQFTAHLPSEAERATRMADAARRFEAFQPYHPDVQSNLYIQIALVSRCDRAMKAALAAPAG